MDFTSFRKPENDLRKKICSQNMFVNKTTFWTFSSDSFYSDLKDALTMSKDSSGKCDCFLFALYMVLFAGMLLDTQADIHTFLLPIFTIIYLDIHAYIDS